MKSRFQNLNSRVVKVTIGSVLMAWFTAVSFANAEFVPVGDLDGDIFFSQGLGVSDDGSVVVGSSISGNGFEAFRWTAGGGMIGLGDLVGDVFFSGGLGVSGDGTVVVGQSLSANGGEAFRWTEAGGMVGLGDLDGGAFSSIAYGVSGDGTVVVGVGTSANGGEAFRWTEAGGMVGLGDLDGGAFSSQARGVSGDGSVVVGFGQSANGTEAFRWTDGGGMVGLGDLDGGAFSSQADGVSGDGSVVVGSGTSGNGNEAFRWTEAGGMVGLGDLAGGAFSSFAIGVNGDGSVVVGRGLSDNGGEAFRWTEASGMQTINEWLAESGAAVADGFVTERANAVNADGSVVVGNGTGGNGNEAWLARAGTGVGAGVITLADFTETFGDTASIPQVAIQLPGLVLNGAHHRPLLALSEEHNLWLTTDFGDFGDDKDATMGLVEVGGFVDLADGLRAGLGVGRSYVEQDLPFSGDNDMEGVFVLGELGYRCSVTSLMLSLTGVIGDWNAEIDRGYLNAGLLDSSEGDTDVRSAAVRLRADLPDVAELGEVKFTPMASFTVTRSKVDSYTETGGGFPARFDSQTHTAREFRLGVTGEYEMSEATKLRGLVEYIHRNDDRGSSFTGEVIGLFPFSIDGADTEENGVRVGAEIDHQLTDRIVLSVAVFGSESSEDADFSTALSLRAGF